MVYTIASKKNCCYCIFDAFLIKFSATFGETLQHWMCIIHISIEMDDESMDDTSIEFMVSWISNLKNFGVIKVTNK
jgi:hypothetical protein